LAHHNGGDIELPKIEKREIDQLIDITVELYNDFTLIFDKSVTSWKSVEDQAKRHTRLLIDDAQKGFEVRQEKYMEILRDDFKRDSSDDE
jgi:hypothetical protein